MDTKQWDYWLLEKGIEKEDNKKRWYLAGALHSQVCTVVKLEVKEAKEKQGRANAGQSAIADQIQKYVDHPLEPKEEGLKLRATLHWLIDTGAITDNVALAEKIIKEIGVHSEDDTSIEVVDFSSAFPDLKTAIEMCTKPCPIDVVSGDK